MSQQNDKGTAGSFLQGLSNDLASAVERAGRYIVRVDARSRQSASGIIWSSDGTIVTADHVVETDEGITIGLPDGREVPARLTARDPGTDIAVLKADVAGLTPVEMAGKGEARVGNLIVAVARPGESGPMATIGVISAMTGPWRTWRGGLIESLVQTDVTLYPGFSGGPLVDAGGRMIGLNSSVLSRGSSAALPVELVERTVQALLSQGRVRRGYLGVSSQPVALPQGLAQRLELSQDTGLLVVGVVPGGPADKGGLILGDVLVAIAGRPVLSADDLQSALTSDKVGVATSLGIIRGGQTQQLTVTIGERE